MADKDCEVRLALLENDFKHLEDKLERLISAVEENNKIINKSKGIVFGASIVISSLWAAGLSIWAYIKT